MAKLDFEYDPKALPAEVKRALDFLYEAADRPAACKAWAECFTKDAVLRKGSFNINGTKELADFIAGSWTPDISRVHDVRKVTVLEASPLQLQVEGISTYQRKTGNEQQGTWKAKQTWAEEDGLPKICEYLIEFNMTY